MNEIDEILLEQLTVARRISKKLTRAKKVMGNDLTLFQIQEMNTKRIQFLENMIEDKTLLHKKVKIKKQKDNDMLARNPMYEWYRIAYVATNLSYKMFMDSATSYMSYFKKGKE